MSNSDQNIRKLLEIKVATQQSDQWCYSLIDIQQHMPDHGNELLRVVFKPHTYLVTREYKHRW